MAVHLAHRLPWGNLTELVQLWPLPDASNVNQKRCYISIGQRKKKSVDHFARCLAGAVEEFRDSDRSSEDERNRFDPRQWPGQREHAIGGWAGFFDSLVGGYIQLNIILSDPDKFVPRFFPEVLASYQFRLMLGDHDGGHPQELAEHLRQAFDGNRLKPLTREVAQVLRDHAAMMFRCMYSISGTNEFIVPKWISYEILILCRLQHISEDEQTEG